MRIKTGSLISALIIILIAAGCKGPKQFISKRSVKDVKSILLVGPFTDVRTIVTGNKQEFDYSLSFEVYSEMDRQIRMLIPEDVKVKTVTSDSATQINILNAAEKIIKDIEKKRKAIKKVIIPDALLNITDSPKQDFCFVILESGFARSYNNFANHLLYNRAAVNLLSFGNIDYVPYKEGSMVIGFIVDRKNKNLAYYKKIIWEQRDPTEKIVIKSQLHDLMMSYFQNAK